MNGLNGRNIHLNRMAVIIQPCDWIESDANFKYVVDVFGRTKDDDVVKVRVKGFVPYFYIKYDETISNGQLQKKLQDKTDDMNKRYNNSRPSNFYGMKITIELKLDAMGSFAGLKPIKVWKISCPSLKMFKSASRAADKLEMSTYETNLPPYIRLFHELDLFPASPFSFEGDSCDVPEDMNVDTAYEIDYKDIQAEPLATIALYLASYDIEVYSESGNFPMSSNANDAVTQIGVSFRYSDDMLNAYKRIVLVNGTVEPSKDSTVEFIGCRNEKELLQKFERLIYNENPDIICGYNTFGFDDHYIADRARRLRLPLNLGRFDKHGWKDDPPLVSTEKKTFELASGKFEVEYIDMPGRLPIDLLLSVRREQNLDSYKLDNVANTFLRDKVTNIVIITGEKTRQFEIHTKNTRGLFAGNLVRFDIVGNTMNPYHDGMKFYVKEVKLKSFIIELEYGKNYLCDFEDLSIEDRTKLEWSFAKDDITPKEMFASHIGTSEQRAEVAKYCIQDCDLVLTLMAKLDTLVNARGMADVCKVPIHFIFLRGQGIKIYSAVVYNASKRNQIIMTQENFQGNMSYEGAIVLPPKIGMYLEQPISVLDFNSLYPSNMIAFNLSPDTLVYVKHFNADGKKIKQEGPDPEEYRKQGYIIDEVSYDVYADDDDDHVKPTGRVTCGFVQHNEADKRTLGFIPLTLDILLKKRKETRKIMEATVDDSQKAVLNGLQLAYKTVANSVYGQCGSATSAIRNIYVAACTTAAGRNRIMDAKQVVISEFGAEVIYGDSVANYTPVITRHLNCMKIMSIEELGRYGSWLPCSDSNKEYCELEDWESWTEDGWVPIERIIRHTLVDHKKMIRVLTHTGLVDVTDDHSLLRLDKTEISPKELKIGDSLLHYQYPTDYELFEWWTPERARIAGFFFGDGSCGSYDCLSGHKYSWALNNANIELLNYYKELCEKEYTQLNWEIYPTLVSSGVFKLSPVSKEYGSISTFVKSYREMLYVDERKNIPEWILCGKDEIRQAFWDGMYDADGDKDMNGYVRVDQKNQTTCAQITFLGNSLGYSISLNTRTDKPLICRMTFTKNKQRKDPNIIKKIHEIAYEGYVYDLTTSNHHFQAGVGQMIVHNTDSIFIQFPTKDLKESIELGKKAAEKITSLLRKPYKIEYEKTFYPFILFSRKRYVGLMYEDDVTKCKRKSMGIALKRRDNAPIVKDVYGGAIDILMEKRDVKAAQDFVKDMLIQVMQNKIPIEKYVVTKQLRDDYKKPGQIAHRVLADRMEQRDAGNKPQLGDRLAFIQVAGRSGKQGDKIEHVDYVKEKNLKPDVDYYITNQIQNPVAQLFSLAIEKLDGYKPRINYNRLLEEYIEGGMSEEKATKEIIKMKEKELDSILFTSAPYLMKHKRGAMDAFVTRR